MATCHDIDPLITPFIDGEAAAPDRAAVDAHVARCPSCRQRVSAERASRLALHERRQTLAGRAPLGLEARCAAVAREARRSRKRRGWGVWLVPVPAAAALVVVALLAYAASGSSTALAAQLTLDHLKCFALFEQQSGPSDAQALEARLTADYGWHMKVPPGSADEGLRLVGARRCFSTDGRIAHILYRHEGRPLSLFLLPETERAAEALAVMGHEAVIWSRGRMTYVVVAREPHVRVEQVAAYIRKVTY
jgi:anti-sigma factor RsiW